MSEQGQIDMFGTPRAAPGAPTVSVPGATKAAPVVVPVARRPLPPGPAAAPRPGLGNLPRRAPLPSAPRPAAAQAPAPNSTTASGAPGGAFSAMRRASLAAPPPSTKAATPSSALGPNSTPARSGFSAMRAAASTASQPVATRPAPQPTKPRDPMAGRGDPPPPGSGWFAVLNWACGGAVDPDREDTDLALKVWSGAYSPAP